MGVGVVATDGVVASGDVAVGDDGGPRGAASADAEGTGGDAVGAVGGAAEAPDPNGAEGAGLACGATCVARRVRGRWAGFTGMNSRHGERGGIGCALV